MTEYIVEFGYEPPSGVKERIVRCRDCKEYRDGDATCHHGNGTTGMRRLKSNQTASAHGEHARRLKMPRRDKVARCCECGSIAVVAQVTRSIDEKTRYHAICKGARCRRSRIPWFSECYETEAEAVDAWNGGAR